MIGMSSLDLLALAWFFACVAGYQFAISYGPLYERSIHAATQRQRNIWMREAAKRENRIIDSQLLANLAQGNAFFASTSLIAVGGLATLMGSGANVQGLLERLPFAAKSTPVLWELKLLLVMVIFVFAFFKFAWAYRLTHYTVILIGAMPQPDSGSSTASDIKCQSHADATAALAGVSANHSNNGLRSFYHAIAAVTWFYHPLLFIAAASWVLAILVRRDFFSRSRRLILSASASAPV